MNKKDIKIKNKLTKISRILSAEFKVESPAIKIDKNKNYCYYKYPSNVIGVNFKSFPLSEIEIQVFLHEYAHYLTRKKFDFNVRHHGEEFCQTLLSIIRFWYHDDLWRYNFDDEYEEVRNWFFDIRRAVFFYPEKGDKID